MSDQPLLIVDDSDDDYACVERAFRKSKVKNPLHRCIDGEDALDFLNQRGAYESAPRPVVVLLDLNLPGTDGREVLVEIKSSAHLRSIPVIVMTTSNDSVDVQRCYDAGANSYLVKPMDMSGFIDAVKRMEGFWLSLAVLPGAPDGSE